MTKLIPGLAVVAALTAVAYAVNEYVSNSISPLVAAVVLGVVLTNLGLNRPALAPGLRFAAKRILRIGIVLLGFRLSLGELAKVGAPGLVVVAVVVAATFFGVQWLGQLLGLSRGFSLLVATGYAICGASAIAAMEPMSDATEEEVAYAVALVTLAGTLAIFVLPPLGRAFGMSTHEFGSWVGASVHDVGQVVATSSGWRNDPDESRKAAIIVKLSRVVLLAPMVAGVSVAHRRRSVRVADARPDSAAKLPPIIPLFVAGFLAAVVARTVGLVGAGTAKDIKVAETLLLSAALVGLGAAVNVRKLIKLGGRPLVLGLISWLLIASLSYAGVILVDRLG